MITVEELAQKLYVCYRESIVRNNPCFTSADWNNLCNTRKQVWLDVAANAFNYLNDKGN